MWLKSFLFSGTSRKKRTKAAQKKLIRNRFLTTEKLETREVFAATGNTIGLIETAGPAAFTGYTLFAPTLSRTSYLINMEGEKVHQWTHDYQPMDTVLEMYDTDGAGPKAAEPILFRMNALSNAGQRMVAPGFGGQLEAQDWDGNIVWTYDLNGPNLRMHHDFEVMPNGNILAVVWQYRSRAEAIENGRDPNSFPAIDDPNTSVDEASLWPDSIVEIKPNFAAGSGGKIVWQWNVWDHLIQNFDPTKKNFGDPAKNPQRIDINYFRTGEGAGGIVQDWNHFNSVDYNPDLNQIMVSSREFSEFWIIDKSTTTAQARRSKGGNSNQGGDLLYRWGNQAAYSKGTFNNQVLSYQHDANWIPPGLPGAGEIMVFNNGWVRPDAPTGGYSTVEQLKAPLNRKWLLNNQQDSNYEIQFMTPVVAANWIPISGDWDGDGKDSTGLYDPKTGTWYLNNKSDGSFTDMFVVTTPVGNGLRPVAGNWDGLQGDSIGVYNPSTKVWSLYNMTFTPGNFASATLTPLPKFKIDAAPANGRPLAGDWDGDGKDSIGMYNPATQRWQATNSLTNSATFGISYVSPKVPNSWRPVAGDWDGDGKDSFGIYDPINNDYYLNNKLENHSASNPLVTVNGPNSAQDTFIPIAGDWNGNSKSTIGLYDPTVTKYYKTRANGVYGPTANQVTYRYTAPAPKEDFFAPIISGARRLPNGNTFINEGTDGRSFEVTPAGAIVWEYKNPVANFAPLRQGTNPPPFVFPGTFANLTFRTYRYGINDPLFAGKTLTSQGVIELPAT